MVIDRLRWTPTGLMSNVMLFSIHVCTERAGFLDFSYEPGNYKYLYTDECFLKCTYMSQLYIFGILSLVSSYLSTWLNIVL